MKDSYDGRFKPFSKLKEWMEIYNYDLIGQDTNFKDTLVGREFKDVEMREWWPMRDHKP